MGTVFCSFGFSVTVFWGLRVWGYSGSGIWFRVIVFYVLGFGVQCYNVSGFQCLGLQCVKLFPVDPYTMMQRYIYNTVSNMGVPGD